MRVLWFSNVPLPLMLRHAGKKEGNSKGHWVGRALECATSKQSMEFAVVAAFPDLRDIKFKEKNVTYYTVGQPHRFNLFSYSKEDIRRCIDAIEDFKPDFIHIHGTERFYGLLKVKGLVKVPVLVSVQGLLGEFSRGRIFFGALNLREILRSVRLLELPVRLGLLWQYFYTVNAARREAKILMSVDAVIGRTSWDRTHIKACKPEMPYFHVGEIMRQSFYKSKWSLGKCERYTLIYTNAGHPSRGTENILAALAILRHDFPSVRLRLAGTVSERSGYGRYLKRKIEVLGLQDMVEFTGFLNEVEMATALSCAHVFVISSYIENSPNSLAEAMLMGMPCVASYTGGIPDMVECGKTGLLYPIEDVPLLADKIRRIFVDDQLAINLGGNAREVALERHDPAIVTEQLLTAYKKFLTANCN